MTAATGWEGLLSRPPVLPAAASWGRGRRRGPNSPSPLPPPPESTAGGKRVHVFAFNDSLPSPSFGPSGAFRGDASVSGLPAFTQAKLLSCFILYFPPLSPFQNSSPIPIRFAHQHIYVFLGTCTPNAHTYVHV